MKKDDCVDLSSLLLAYVSHWVVFLRFRLSFGSFDIIMIIRDESQRGSDPSIFVNVTRRSLFPPPYALLALFLIGRASHAKS